jgi:hypothetical protein
VSLAAFIALLAVKPRLAMTLMRFLPMGDVLRRVVQVTRRD